MNHRDTAVQDFLVRAGFAGRTPRPLAQDASLRRYLWVDEQTLVMDAPPPEDVRPFLRIAAHLHGLGLSVPRVFAADETRGLVAEEHLGDSLFTSVLNGANRWTLIETAVDALIVMQRAAPPPDLPVWGKAAMIAAALNTLFEWWWSAMHGSEAPAAARADIAAALDTMLEPVARGPVCFVHRDYFAGNLIWLPERTCVRRTGIIDFQSAALGHPAYDLASLLQDSRGDTASAVEARAIAHYLSARPELEPVSFQNAYDACAAQRHLRVACQWVRLAHRDGRPHYLHHGPHTWAMLNRALKRPAVAPLAAALDRWVPPERRCNPPAGNR